MVRSCSCTGWWGFTSQPAAVALRTSGGVFSLRQLSSSPPLGFLSFLLSFVFLSFLLSFLSFLLSFLFLSFLSFLPSFLFLSFLISSFKTCL